MKTQNTISIRLKNDLNDLKRLNKALSVLEKQLDLTSKCHCQLNIILEEIFTNILKYAFTDKNTHFIDIRIAYEKEFLTIQVEDDGHPFNPFEAKKPNLDAPLEERDIGGLGVFFIKQFADEIIYKRKKNKNYIALKKKIDQNG